VSILKLDEHDESREIEFELSYLKSLTINERFILMVNKSNEMKELLRNCGHRKPSEIIKRT
jgi:nitrite reductase/ring-hydroxylating ferredoxin subunit